MPHPAKATLFPYTTLFRSGLGGERKLCQVGKRAAVLRLHPRGVELPAVMRHVVVRVLQRPAQPLELQLLQIGQRRVFRSEEHTSELQSRENLVCRLLLEKK